MLILLQHLEQSLVAMGSGGERLYDDTPSFHRNRLRHLSVETCCMTDAEAGPLGALSGQPPRGTPAAIVDRLPKHVLHKTSAALLSVQVTAKGIEGEELVKVSNGHPPPVYRQADRVFLTCLSHVTDRRMPSSQTFHGYLRMVCV
jgi:hypothetical protein